MKKLRGRESFKVGLQLLLFIAIIGGGWIAARYFINNKPTARRSRPVPLSPLVDILPAQSSSKTVIIKAMGTVIPSKEISLYSQLTGTIDWISPNFVPGGKIAEGEEAIRLNREDYELAVRKQESVLLQLQADLDLEVGQQAVAKKEIELMRKSLGKTIKNPDLALRVPQMNKALASLKVQQIGLEQAQLNLKRTQITAPFNSMVLNRSIELGSRITAQSVLATLIGTDVFWIEAAVPVKKLHWITIPQLKDDRASRVSVQLQDGSVAEGVVIRLLGKLNSKSQMARILIQVDDPLGVGTRSGQMPLLLDSYVSLEFIGSEIKNVIEIPRRLVKDGNQIWILEQEQLKIRTIQPIWEDENSFYVQNSVKPGELIITSEMSAAVHGMSVRSLSLDKAAVKKSGNQRKKGIVKPSEKPQQNINSQES